MASRSLVLLVWPRMSEEDGGQGAAVVRAVAPHPCRAQFGRRHRRPDQVLDKIPSHKKQNVPALAGRFTLLCKQGKANSPCLQDREIEAKGYVSSSSVHRMYFSANFNPNGITI